MLTRWAASAVREALTDTPVVLIHGPRQCGKSTLAISASDEAKRRVVTLDDREALLLAKQNPSDFVRTFTPPVTIDEVQRAPELFLAMKAWVDRTRIPGSFLLTGSANVLMLPKMADSLAGRMEIVDLRPLAQAEIEGTCTNPIDRLFDADFEFGGSPARSDDQVYARAVVGGYPEPVLRSARRRDAWFESYVRTILERDVRDLSNIDGLTQLPRLLTFLALRNGETINLASLSRDVGVPHTTLTRYVDLMQALFLIQMVPAWSKEGARFAKAAKCYLVDTGLLCHLRRVDLKSLITNQEMRDMVLNSFVANELGRMIPTSDGRPSLLHLRTVRQKEVDFVLERADGQIVGIEVTTSGAPRLEDAEGLRWLAEIAGERFLRGIVLHVGTESRPLAPKIAAVPVDFLWQN